MNDQLNQNVNGQRPEIMTGGIVGGVQNLFDKVKGPVFWLAAGYVLHMIVTRKKARIIKV